MKRYLPVIAYTILLFLFYFKASAQSGSQTQTVTNGSSTTAVAFPAGGCTYTWTNDKPGIGLAASGSGNIPSFKAVNTGSTPVTATIKATPVVNGFAYVANSGSNNVSVINTATSTVVGTISVGNQPFCLTVSPDGSRVYVANFQSGTVSVINTLTKTVIATISVGVETYGITVSPDGSKVYTSNEIANTVSVISTATNTVTSTIAVPAEPTDVMVSPDGSKLYVTSSLNANSILVYNALSQALITTISTGFYPFSLISSPDGSKLYVIASGGGAVSVINTTDYTITATIVGLNSIGMAITPDGSALYVTNNGSHTVSIISTATNAIVKTITVGNQPEGVSVSPDGSLVYVVNETDGDVSVINTVTNTVKATIRVGSNPVSFGNFITGASGCSPVTYTIVVNPTVVTPPVIATTGALSPLSTTYGTPSSSAVFNVSGNNLQAGIFITPPMGFEVSIDDINFTKSATISAAGNIIAPTVVYIRLAATTPVGNYLGNVVLSSAGSANVTVAIPKSTVTPASLIVTAENKSKTYETINPVLTVKYAGFVNNENAADLTVQPVITTTANTLSPVGEYPIMVSGAASPNYIFSYIPGVLTINPAGLIVPNAFTPNGDGINDAWDIKYIQNYPNCTVEVYNRYGEKLYSSIGYPIPWDGKYKGANLPVGTYYYIINPKGGLKVISGYVAIIR